MAKWGSTCNHNYLHRWPPCQYFILLMMGAWRPKHVEKVCSNKICILLHHVGVLFSLKQCTCYWLQLWRPFMRQVKTESYYVYIHIQHRDLLGSYTVEVTEIMFCFLCKSLVGICLGLLNPEIWFQKCQSCLDCMWFRPMLRGGGLEVIKMKTLCSPNNNNNNNNNNLLEWGYHPVAVVILHVYKIWNWLLINLSLEGYMRSM